MVRIWVNLLVFRTVYTFDCLPVLACAPTAAAATAAAVTAAASLFWPFNDEQETRHE